MKEYKVGEQITLEVEEAPKGGCEGCFFENILTPHHCEDMCMSCCRSDDKNVIFVEKGK